MPEEINEVATTASTSITPKPYNHHDIFTRMVEHWPSTVVAAPEVKRFSGGIVSGKTLANLRSLGEPVPESIKVGSKRAFVAESLADWLRQRTVGGPTA